MEGSERNGNGARPLPGRIAAFLYDFDDTIAETERLNDELFCGLLRDSYGLSLSTAEQEAMYGFSWNGVFDWLAANRGFRPDRAELWDRFLRAKRARFAGRATRLATGIDAMLALPARHAIVSGSTREEVDLIMRGSGLAAGAFDAIICDGEYARGKPAPDGWLMALERLRVPASAAVVFEDSLPGIRSAQAAGVTAAFVAELAAKDWSAEADVAFATLAEAHAAVGGKVVPVPR
jgi:HAD superfamily hydrolase (TIGR01509 family)